MVVFNIVVFLISLSVVIMLHELGHFIMARRAGILCHEFSLGMGPKLWSKRFGETMYSIRAIPIGGFVMMSGEEIEDELVKEGMQVRLEFKGNLVSKIYLDHDKEGYEKFEKITVEKVDLKGKDFSRLYINDHEVKRDAFYVMRNRELQIAPYDRGFNGKTLWQRFWAIFSGPAMNFILAIFVFLAVNLIVGFPTMDSTVLGGIGEGYPAEDVLEVGDKVLSINGNDIGDWDDLSFELDSDKANRLVEFEILRDGTEMTQQVTPIIYFYSIGFHSDSSTQDDLIIGEIAEETKADSAGMLQGDQLVSIDGNDVVTWSDVITEIETLGALEYLEGRIIKIEVLRDGNTVELDIHEPYSTEFLNTQGINVVETRVGISPVYNFSLGSSIVASFQNVGTSAMMIFTTIGLLFDNSGAGAGIGVDNLAGPLGIYEITSIALSNGFISLLSWIGLLSVNLGVINLLPIPALDGGRLVFLGYEALSKRKPNRKVESTLNYVMFMALMGLFIFITFNDILRLFNIK